MSRGLGIAKVSKDPFFQIILQILFLDRFRYFFLDSFRYFFF